MVDSTTPALDRIDRQLLADLQLNGRLSMAELARRVHLSPTACVERIKRLERDGLIRDYVARLDAARVGLPVLAYVEVELDRTTAESFARFRSVVREFDEVLECHMVAGQFDYLLKVRVASLAAFRRFLGERLTSIQGLVHTRTYMVLEEVKADAPLAIHEPSKPAGRRRGKNSAAASSSQLSR